MYILHYPTKPCIISDSARFIFLRAFSHFSLPSPIPPGDPRNELGTRWIGFEPTNGSYGIHGTIAPESIGKAVGNGCVRMLNEDVEELYDLVVAETPVEVIPGEGR